MTHDDSDSTFRPQILFVCLANQCRSPLAEFIFAEQAERNEIPIRVSSAGERAIPGEPMHQFAKDALGGRGIETGDWVARRLSPQLIADADLVLTAERQQLRAVGTLSPAALRKSFTILQFAHLATAMEPIHAIDRETFRTELVKAASRARSKGTPLVDQDLADPIRKGAYAFERCAKTLERAAADTMRALQREPVH